MTDKQIIVTFSDGYCIVLEDNKVSIRENEFTKLCIVVGNRTNELLEFVKNIYLDNKRKEQECEELKEKVKKYGEINKQETKDYAELKAENDLFRTCHNNEQAKRRKYGQAIEDIKEIAKKTLNMVDYKTYFKRNNKSIKQEGFKALNEILQKISEVEK